MTRDRRRPDVEGHYQAPTGDDPARWREGTYPTDYSGQVQKAINFIGAKHDYFIEGKARWLRAFLKARGMTVTHALDIGCGVGLLHRYLRDFIPSLVGVDLSVEAIKEAKQRNPGNAYQAYDGARLPFPDGIFDLVLAVTVMHHVPTSQWSHFVAEARRVLRRGGVFVVIEHNPLNPLTLYSVNQCPFDEDAVLLRAGQVRSLMAENGLHGLGQDYIFFTPFSVKMIQAIERRLAWLPLGAQYAAWGESGGI
jgi:SAM-dependent methyltransferase